MKPIIFSEGDSKTFENSVNEAMDLAIKHFDKELTSIRTGRASTAIFDGLKVECYGQLMGIKEIASLSAPDARLITIQPWDKSIIGDIEKAILASDIGITPVNDGQLIRLQFPMISSQRREELVKVLGKKTEECRVSIRNVRKEAHNFLREAEKEKLISEDFAERLSHLLQKITDKFIEKTDAPN
ncbi:MAG: Ribosome-recycling factor [candidate division TM6 bacterium GW2011_GWF2_33_332]|nr:MAG: Ribosome-recycling factor [candidate division TM6 bacterium GW2011_GWF2_33_332]